jgi:hypothetical protein
MLLELIEREYNLGFVDSESMVFNPNLIKSTCHLKKIGDTPREGNHYYITVDTAYGKEEYFVAMIFESKNNHYYQTEMYRERKNDSIIHEHKISELIKKYNPVKVGVETTGIIGKLSFERLQKKNPDINFVKIRITSESKSMMIEKLNVLLVQHKLSLADAPIIQNEFLSFEKKENGLMGTVGDNSDDIVMATAFLTELIDVI